MTQESVRKLPCLIEGFIEWLKPCEAPLNFKRWAAITLISGCLERRVWAWGKGYKIHPNLFTLLIGPPGSGKSSVIKPVQQLWAATGKLNVISNAATRAAFVESIAGPPNPKVLTIPPNPPFQYCHGVLPLSEFGTFFRENDIDLMNTLTDFYDASDTPFIDKTISRGQLTVDRPSLCILAGTQPNYLHRVLPEDAFKLGFATRLVMTYTANIEQGALFSQRGGPDEGLRLRLIHDLKHICTIAGEFTFTDEAQNFLGAWYETGQEPRPTHLRLQDYNTRRWASIFKIAMALTVSRGDTLVCDVETTNAAMDLLFAAEASLPEAFKNMGGDSDATYINEGYEFVWRQFARDKKAVREGLLTGFLMTKVPAHRVRPIIEVMLQSGVLKHDGAFPPGSRLLTPAERSRHVAD